MESIFEVQQLYDLLVQFHTLTGIRVTIFDLNMEVITEYPDDRSEYCSIVRSKPELDRNCRMGDKTACEQCRRSGKLQIYSCYAGLQEVALPIKMNEITLGYIIFGQLRDSEQSRPEHVRAFAREPDFLKNSCSRPMEKRCARAGRRSKLPPKSWRVAPAICGSRSR